MAKVIDFFKQTETAHTEKAEPVPLPNESNARPTVIKSGAPQTQNEKLQKIINELETGVSEIFTGDKYRKYLDTMSKFHNYSFHNICLINKQNPDATLVAGFQAWQKNFKRTVKKGEHGLQILAPVYRNVTEEIPRTNSAGKPILTSDGQPVTDAVQVKKLVSFKPVFVFDVSQTEGKPLPTIAAPLTGSVDGYRDFFTALEKTSPVPIGFEAISGGANGFFNSAENRIAVNAGMSEMQTIKTTIHEIAHSKLHAKNPLSRGLAEVQAESVAYTVCRHYGLDTSEFSFDYIAGWSRGRDLNELKQSLDIIQKTSAGIINSVDKHLAELKPAVTQTQSKEFARENAALKPKVNTFPKSRHFTDDELAQARKASVVDYLTRQGYSFKKEGNQFRCAEHNSLVIKADETTWFWNSRGTGGRNLIDFKVRIEDMSFAQAVEDIIGYAPAAAQARTEPPAPIKESPAPKPPAKFALPKKFDGKYSRAYAYLCHRGIDPQITSILMKKGYIYQDVRNNVVFVGYNGKEAAYAALRSTADEFKFRGEAAGSDKAYGFKIGGYDKESVYVFESPIDLLSHATLANLEAGNNRAWLNSSRISLGGCSSHACLEQYLKENPTINRIVCCLDNDEAGRKATETIRGKFTAKGYRVDTEVPILKDFNEDLISKVQSVKPPAPQMHM